MLISGINQCRIEFDWETKYACSIDVSSSNWNITNPKTGQVYNLMLLKPELSATVIDHGSNTK